MLTLGHLGITIDTLLKVILDTLQPSLLSNGSIVAEKINFQLISRRYFCYSFVVRGWPS